jgi:hypothetical protein
MGNLTVKILRFAVFGLQAPPARTANTLGPRLDATDYLPLDLARTRLAAEKRGYFIGNQKFTNDPEGRRGLAYLTHWISI